VTQSRTPRQTTHSTGEMHMRRVKLGRAGRLAAGLIATAGVGVGAVGALAGTAGAAGTLTNVQVSVSNDTTGATGVTYSVNFTTATASTLTSVTISGFDSSLAGTPTVAECFGLNCSGATASVSSGTITLTLSSQSVAANVPVLVELSGLTNQTVAGTDTLAVSTVDTSGSTSTTVDTASTSLAFGQSTTAVTVAVPEALQFTNSAPDIYVTPIPNGGVADAACGTGYSASTTPPGDVATSAAEPCPVVLSVLTNANGGYTLTAEASALTNTAHSGVTLPEGTPASGSNAFGIVSATVTGGTAGATSGGYNTTGSPTVLMSSSGPTGNTANTDSIQNGASVNYGQAAGTYTGTITYAVTPSY
jgi:hypothetical protein